MPPGRVARWWATALAAELDGDWGDTARVRSLADGAPRLLFIQVPEPKRGKNRVHLDLLAGTRDAEAKPRSVEDPRVIGARAARQS